MVPHMRALLVLALAGAGSVAAAGAGTSASGLHGIVLRGPTSPVCHVGDPCEEPAKGLLLQFRRNGRVVKEVRTSRTGRYRILLRAGRYAVTTPRVRRTARLRPQLVSVPRNRVAQLVFHLDTGIQ